MTVYTCAACKLVLPTVNGLPQRCGCNAPIIASLQAVASGVAKVN